MQTQSLALLLPHTSFDLALHAISDPVPLHATLRATADRATVHVYL